MEITHGYVYVNNELVGWATYVEELFSHTLKALVLFLTPQFVPRWDSFELRVRIQIGGTQYLKCSNIKKVGAATLDGRVWNEYLIGYEEKIEQADETPDSKRTSDSST